MFCACGIHGNSMNNLVSYCGLFDARTSASEKDLPVTMIIAAQTKLSPNLTKPNLSLLSKIVIFKVAVLF